MFVNRTRELAFLHTRYASGQAELVVLYGRRVGKTELLRTFCQDKPHIFLSDGQGCGHHAVRALARSRSACVSTITQCVR